jgi:hypothetical protein
MMTGPKILREDHQRGYLRLVVAAKGILMLFRSGTTKILFNH